MLDRDVIRVDIWVPNQKRYLKLIGNIAEEVIHALDDDGGDHEALAFHLNLVLTEALVNAIEHAIDESPEQLVRVSISVEDGDLCARVYDHGHGFDIDQIPYPNLDIPEEKGRGIFLMRTLMDAVRYRKSGSGNVLEMRKRLACGPPA